MHFTKRSRNVADGCKNLSGSSTYPSRSKFHPAGTTQRTVYGNAGSGRICYTTKTILTSIWIISIAIPSNMASTTSVDLTAFKFSSIVGAGVFIRFNWGHSGDFSIHGKTNDSNDAPPICRHILWPSFRSTWFFTVHFGVWVLCLWTNVHCNFVVFYAMLFDMYTKSGRESHASIYEVTQEQHQRLQSRIALRGQSIKTMFWSEFFQPLRK